jgi:hypothetical protein
MESCLILHARTLRSTFSFDWCKKQNKTKQNTGAWHGTAGKRKNSNETKRKSKTHKELTPSCANAAIRQKIEIQRFFLSNFF